MDDYALQQELEALAGNAFGASANDQDSKPEPMRETLARWGKLFGLSQDDAVDLIMDHRNDLTRVRISDAHWESVRADKEAAGYDREAYEYELGSQKRKANLPNTLPAAGDADASSVTYLVELTGPLESAERIRQVAGLERAPTVVHGRSVEDGRQVSLCCVDGAVKTAILAWASAEGAGFEPTILVDPRSLR